MKKLVLTIWLVGSIHYAGAQGFKDSILINERSIDRRINVHQGQMRLNGGYQASIISSRFDENGDKIDLGEEGITSLIHTLFFEFLYGVHKYVQVRGGINHLTEGVRSEGLTLVPLGTEPNIQINQLQQFKGFSDLFLGVDARAPLPMRELDIIGSFGATLPIAAHEPDQPSHNAERSSDLLVLNYQFNNKNGNGVPILFFGGAVKYRFPDLAFSVFGNYGYPTKEGESIVWKNRLLSNDQFEHRSSTYAYQLGTSMNIAVIGEYQVFSFFDVILAVATSQTEGGWSEVTGKRVATFDSNLWVIAPGYELLITPKLWLRQRIEFAISGESVDAPFVIRTGLSYNFFPF